MREGAEDGKYLYTLAESIKKAKASGDPALIGLATDAQKYLDGLYAQVHDIPEYDMKEGTFPHVAVCRTIEDLKFFDNFRYKAAQYIKKLQGKLDGR